MSADTTATNRNADSLEGDPRVWVFGYGSLIWKTDFPYLERRPAHIHGWTRRFWQGSHDHRGTPTSPGRVVTLIRETDAVCAGMAFLVTPDVFAHLDHREKNGYLRVGVALCFENGGRAEGIVYIADGDNAAFLGAATESEIAAQIARSSGPSGSNRDYLLLLARALREIGAVDPHVFAIERALLAMPTGQRAGDVDLSSAQSSHH
ncbi:MAG: gamma-glutamylcyclotransferase [Rhodanobacteraceae bacterium]